MCPATPATLTSARNGVCGRSIFLVSQAIKKHEHYFWNLSTIAGIVDLTIISLFRLSIDSQISL